MPDINPVLRPYYVKKIMNVDIFFGIITKICLYLCVVTGVLKFKIVTF